MTRHVRLADALGWFDGEGAPAKMTPEEIASALQSGTFPSDATFDALLPEEVRAVSRQHFTPIATAAFGALWLEREGARHVVDIGAGSGKLCVVGALVTDMRFSGIEERAHLVCAARDLASTFDVGDRVRFTHGTFGRTALPAADAYYLYNPFEENLFAAADWLDEAVEHTRERFIDAVQAVHSLLAAAPAGTLVLTYNGFGAPPPHDYRELRHASAPVLLQLWRKDASV